MRTEFIYTLIDPRTKLIRYVGKTADPVSRLATHISSAKANAKNQRLKVWIRGLISLGLKPIINIVHTCSSSDVGYWEGYYYLKYEELDLLNDIVLGTIQHDPAEYASLINECKNKKVKTKTLRELLGMADNSTISCFLNGYPKALSTARINQIKAYLASI